MSNLKQAGKTLQKIRKEKFRSGTAFCDALTKEFGGSMTQASLSNYERGAGRPRPGRFNQICQILKIKNGQKAELAKLFGLDMKNAKPAIPEIRFDPKKHPEIAAYLKAKSRVGRKLDEKEQMEAFLFPERF